MLWLMTRQNWRLTPQAKLMSTGQDALDVGVSTGASLPTPIGLAEMPELTGKLPDEVRWLSNGRACK